MITNKNRAAVVFLAAWLTVSLTACSAEDTEAVFAGPEETLQEAVPDTAYIEDNELKYEENTRVASKGTLCAGEDSDDPDIIDVDWELTNITMDNAEDGMKTVTIEQSVYGYVWTDGETFKTNLNVPVARLADAYTGRMLAEDTEIEWKETTYMINVTETASWEDGSWDTDWVEDSNGGKRLSSTLKVKTVAAISEDYDGLSLVLVPVTDVNGSADGKYIMDVWADGSYLFNVNALSAGFEKAGDGAEFAETDPEEEREPKQEETIAAHTHSYVSVITTQPTCTANGVRTYTCRTCGNSYTEKIAAVPHDFSVPVVQLVHHDEQWKRTPHQVEDHSQIIEVECTSCGTFLETWEEYENHVLESIERETRGGEYPEGILNACQGWYCITYGTKTVYDEEKIADAYDAEEVVGYQCSMCGLSTVR